MKALRKTLISLSGSSGSLRERLVHGAIGSVGIRVASTLVGFLLSVLLARSLGPSGYGVYSFVYALVIVLAMPAQLGLPKLVIRETASAHANEEWGIMRGLWRWSNATVFLLSACIAIIVLIGLYVLRQYVDGLTQTTMLVGLILIPIAALGNLRGAAMTGLRRVVLGQLPEHLLRPGLFVLLLLAALTVYPTRELSPADAMVLHSIAAILAFGIGIALIWRTRPAALVAAPAPLYRARAWMRAALPLALIDGLGVVQSQTGIIILGLFRSAEEVGIYRVSLAGSGLVAFGLVAINMVVAPFISRLYTQRDMERLQVMVTLSARAILVTALPVIALLVFYGRELLEIFFGIEYVEGYGALAILAIGHLVNAGMGSVALLLNMTGYESDTMRGVAVATLMNVVLSVLLVPPFGINGAAAATCVSMVIANLVLWRAVHKRLGIESMAFQFFGKAGK